MRVVSSWGRVLTAVQDVREPAFVDQVAQQFNPGITVLAHGLGRSYGDVCLNDGGILIQMHRLDRILSVDWVQGILRAEAGISFDALIRVCVPRGWFLPVVPGTKFVTLGGAIANDVHGKNHESAASFGSHVRAIGLLRSSGEILELSSERNAALFSATVGGLGLTGLILWAEIALSAIPSAYFDTETERLANLDQFFTVADASRDWPYTVAWVDCLAAGPALGRGLFTRARSAVDAPLTVHRPGRGLSVPFDAPARLLSAPAVSAFNLAYSHRYRATGRRRMHYDSFLFPLDRVGRWNRLYGRKGFFQHQSVVSLAEAPRALRRLLELTAAHRQGSFLVVLKMLGARASPGMLSFPMEGATFALDLPNRGEQTRALLAEMTDVVLDAGGRIYPAKDATMSGEAFRKGYPRWGELESARDPAIQSDFWRRVTRDAK
jgi:L-gulonolactone oxidase